MIVLTARNVREALPIGVDLLNKYGQREKSQYGDVLVMPCPVTTIYTTPRERVLFDPRRDANPFFHLMESLWMLAGRHDSTFLNQYVKDFGSRFAEPGGVIHDAYGHRWRRAFGVDQLKVIINRLIENPDDRQCVLQMWDADAFDDLSPTAGWKTRPCNTHAYFRVVGDELTMTVCCRSNDIIWGAYGANAVHFSVLLEYVAAMSDFLVGKYYQMSNNYHAYAEIFEKYAGLEQVDGEAKEYPSPLVLDPQSFDAELGALMLAIDSRAVSVPQFNNQFLDRTAFRMHESFALWRSGNKESAIDAVQSVEAEDWRRAGLEWMQRRMK